MNLQMIDNPAEPLLKFASLTPHRQWATASAAGIARFLEDQGKTVHAPRFKAEPDSHLADEIRGHDLLPYLANAVTHYFNTPMSIEELFLNAK
ncbi:hypothetical protein [Aeromonas sp. MdU4]|uniref:hypothetical protein n=1 Tax=Aeromonas sp. MdU4 TaxID=3342819 RepID=UPI0035B90A7B